MSVLFGAVWRGGVRRFLVLAAALLFLPWTLCALQMPKLKIDSSPLPRSTGQVTSYAPIVSNVAPSVVSVYSRKAATGLGLDPLLRRFFGGRQEQALGSGVIVSEDGYILTNSHVVEDASEIRVATEDGTEYSAKLIGLDSPTDVAVIKIAATNLVAATLADSSKVRVGDVVLAVGNPFGVGQTVTWGIVSGTERAGLGITEYEDFIQTDAPINPGNSGGSLVDALGRVVGLNTAIFSRSGGSMGIGFAVPVNMARSVMTQIIEHGRVVRGFLGVSVQPLTPDLAKEFKAPSTHGALVGGVSANTPASRAGLKEGDVIVEINGNTIENSRALRLLISQTPPGTPLKLGVLRNGKRLEITAMAGELPQQGKAGAAPKERAQPESPLEGVEAQELDNGARRELGVPRDISGIVVTDVDAGSAAYRAGLRPGDVIMEINRTKISNLDQAQNILRKNTEKTVLLHVWSDGATRFVVVEK